MRSIRISRDDLNLKTPALEEALGPVTPRNDFDVMAEARAGFVRLGDLKASEAPLVESESKPEAKPETKRVQESGLRGKMRAVREALGG